MPSGGWMPEIDVFAQWQLEQQQPFAINRLEQHQIRQQQPIATVPDSPPVSMIGMKRGRLSDLDQTLFGKRHRTSIECNDAVSTDPSQSLFPTSDAYTEKVCKQTADEAQTTTPVIEAERHYNNGYVEYFGSAQNMQQQLSSDEAMETVEGVQEPHHQSQSASPNTCEQYVTKGCYSPRQVQSYCRPTFGRSGDACSLFPYHSDCY